jgi:hypothetical protein
MFKVYEDMLKSDKQRVKGGQSTKFGYLPMMAVDTLGTLNAESFCECVLSCVKLVVSDLHVRLKPSEIRILVMLRMNRGFMEYMRKTYPPLIPIFSPMDSMLSWTMRKKKKMRRSEDFLVDYIYND